MIREMLSMALEIALCALLLAPIIGGLGFALIEKWWKCRLDFQARVAMAQAEAMRAMADAAREKPGENEQHV